MKFNLKLARKHVKDKPAKVSEMKRSSTQKVLHKYLKKKNKYRVNQKISNEMCPGARLAVCTAKQTPISEFVLPLDCLNFVLHKGSTMFYIIG